MLASLFSKCQLKWMADKARVAFTNPDKDLKAKDDIYSTGGKIPE